MLDWTVRAARRCASRCTRPVVRARPRPSGTLPGVHSPPEYTDFYVAVLTIVPIVLAGHFVLIACASDA